MIEKRNLMSKKAGISYTQILILVISTFAFCYIIYSATEVAGQSQILREYSCCEKTTGGNYCQYNKTESCASGFRTSPKLCESTEFCELGCCIDGDGFCTKRSPKRSCTEGTWFEDDLCNGQNTCKRGCCIIGSNALWVYPGECKSDNPGLTADFKSDVISDFECIFLTERHLEGACVYEDDGETTCRFITGESCRNIGGDPYPEKFCSDPAFGTNCQAHDSKGCARGSLGADQSVYWFDSCGNREEVAETCSLAVGSTCGLVDGEYRCKSVNCEIDGETYRNGASWCEYEGTVGEGKDVVGSRHIKHICFMGEERIEPCEDYRNQICVSSEKQVLDNGLIWMEAACRVNNWRSCLEYNSNSWTSAGKCEENPDCYIKSIAIDEYEGDPSYAFDLCVPSFPPGLGLDDSNEGRRKSAEAVCGIATQSCKVTYVKEWDGDWECEVNCDCETLEFTEKMNELCTSLGDCGAYVNIAGESTDDGYSVSRAPRLPRLKLDESKKYARYKANQLIKASSLSFLGTLGGPSRYLPQITNDPRAGYAAMGIGAIGYLIDTATLAGLPVIGDLGVAIGSAGGGTGAYEIAASEVAMGNFMAAVGAIFSVAAILQIVFRGMDFGTAIAIAAGVTFGVYMVFEYGVAGTTGWGAVGVLGIFAIIIMIIFFIIGVGDTKDKTVNFDCLPWEPPIGGDNCELCNPDDPFGVPCSDYRCRSLGQGCEFINKGTEEEKCVNLCPGTVTTPRISPLLGTIEEGYQYIDANNNNFQDGFELGDLLGNCIPEFTPVNFGIETDMNSQCKIGTDPLQEYDEMEAFFGDNNLYSKKHEAILNIPSPAAFANRYNLTDAQIRELGEVNLYVKCKEPCEGRANAVSYTIRTCIKPGPDLTSPYIRRVSPENGAYVAYNQTEQDLQVWTNEPTQCRWSRERKPYGDMENSMNCQTGLGDYGIWGWPCNTTLSLTDNNLFYINCQDTSENHNTMTNPYVYELQKSESELEIVSIKPDEDIIGGGANVIVTLEVVTEGGAENGKAKCEWEEKDKGWTDFFADEGVVHEYPELPLFEDDYKFDIKCWDVAGNIATGSTEFGVDIDEDAPRITRVYYDGSLRVMTDEPSICGYSFEDPGCNFEMENSTLMSGEGKVHSADWQTENTYYVKCEDHYENDLDDCSIIIRPYDVI
jgi:hypothetical protein